MQQTMRIRIVSAIQSFAILAFLVVVVKRVYSQWTSANPSLMFLMVTLTLRWINSHHARIL